MRANKHHECLSSVNFYGFWFFGLCTKTKQKPKTKQKAIEKYKTHTQNQQNPQTYKQKTPHGEQRLPDG